MKAGFRCIKVKIGAIDFQKELELLGHIRKHFSPEQIELRVDANGAFTPEEALTRLEALHKFHLHSIEQPIRAGQWQEMKRLCAESPFPIALDEELIGVNDTEQKSNCWKLSDRNTLSLNLHYTEEFPVQPNGFSWPRNGISAIGLLRPWNQTSA